MTVLISRTAHDKAMRKKYRASRFEHMLIPVFKPVWFLVFLCILNIHNVASAGERFTDMVKKQAPVAHVSVTDGAVRYYSGAMTYQERMIAGRWVGAQWSSCGRIGDDKTYLEQHLGEPGWPPLVMSGYPIEAFALEIDGQDLRSNWVLDSVTHEEPEPGRSHVQVHLHHTVRPVRIVIHTKLDGTPFIERWLEITNTSERPAALGNCMSFSGLLWRINSHEDLMPEGNTATFRLGHYPDWFNFHEGNFLWTDLPDGTYTIDEKHGRSGFSQPFFVLRNEVSGGIFMGALAWSDNWQMRFNVWQNPYLGEAKDFTSVFLEAGPIGPAPLRLIAPGETIRTPSMHIGTTSENFDEAIQSWHEHLRRSVIPPQPRGGALVQMNHVDYIDLNGTTTDIIMSSIDVAAKLGIEVFVVDAGWFGGKDRKVWDKIVGDWQEGAWMAPGGGLRAIRDRIHEKGMLFGLWIEPERIGSESKIYKEHPDWVLKRDGQDVGGFALNLTKPEVAQWMEQQLNSFVENYKPDLLRLDYNGNVWAGGQNLTDGYIEHTSWRYYEAAWGIYERLAKRYPKMIMENCGAGGGRCDLGMMSRFHQTWVSDESRMPRAIQILNGMTLALPPEVVNRFTHSGSISSDNVKRGDLNTHLRMTLFGQMMVNGIAPTVDTGHPYAIERAQHYIKLYKDFVRPMHKQCLVYHHTPSLEPWKKQRWCILEYAAADHSQGMAGIFGIHGATTPEQTEYRFRARGVDRTRRYRVEFENSGQSITIDGQRLCEEGVSVRLENAIASELILYRAVD